jgi:hypothetical protein
MSLPKDLPAPARYFPVEPEPLRMQAGLLRFGTDFGNGPRDGHYFQVDVERPRYIEAKRAAPAERHVLAGDDSEAEMARAAALRWMRERLAETHPAILVEIDADDEARDPLDAVARAVQEDFAVILAGDGDAGRAVALDVRFPSGWRPERLAGASFARIHAPVPGFAKVDAAAQSMVRAMVDRGPYVRFVWTLSADDALDHHPESGRRVAWDDARDVFLRVERQVTVPLPPLRASVFLIRTYLYPWASLPPRERDVLRAAMASMPEDVRQYKGLPTLERLEAVLAAAGLR